MDFERLPKIDLHLHLDGAVRTRTIRSLADAHGLRLPAPLSGHVTVGRSCRSLRDFLACFRVFLPVLRSPEAIERIAYELCEDCANDNVIYFEVRYAPALQESRTCSLEDSVQAAIRGLRREGRDFGVDHGLILCLLRDRPEFSLRTVRAAARFGVAGIDMANDERAPASAHAPAFRLAHRHGFPITVHCGEDGPASNVREAVDRLGARRIGHGVRAVDDPRLVECLARDGIGIETCLTSNLQTRAVRSLREHPFPTFYAAGIPVTLNTDDPRVSRTTLSREYRVAAKAFGLKRADYRKLLDNAVRTAFCTGSVRARLRKRLRP